MPAPTKLFSALLALGFFAPNLALAETSASETPSLRTYAELRRELTLLEWFSLGRVQTGPLVEAGRNGGLVDIDVPVDTVLPSAASLCGGTGIPTIRQAVTCTVEASGRGNHDPDAVGFSTQGRPLLAARFGRPGGIKVAYITQQHGNEVASTEAAMRFLRTLAFSRAPWVRQARAKLDILFLIRANPDGSEPDPSCPAAPFATGATYPEDCALTRWNVDKSAGGGYLAETEADFYGVVGQGYDLNRYHYAELDHPIRPVEAQTMVAALLAFGPQYLFDLHGDVVKTTCDIDLATVTVLPGLGLPVAACQAGTGDLVSFSVSDFANPAGGVDRDRGRILSAKVAGAVDRLGFGPVVRFAQASVGSGAASAGSLDTYRTVLGTIPNLWEVRNFGTSSVVLGVNAVSAGQPVVGITNDTAYDPAVLDEGIRMNHVALATSVRALTRLAHHAPPNDGDYCAIPRASGGVFTLDPAFFGPNPIATQPGVLPFALVPTLTLDDCP